MVLKLKFEQILIEKIRFKVRRRNLLCHPLFGRGTKSNTNDILNNFINQISLLHHNYHSVGMNKKIFTKARGHLQVV